MVFGGDDPGFKQKRSSSEADSDEEDDDGHLVDESVTMDVLTNQIRLSLFRTENGTSWFPQIRGDGPTRRTELLSNTLQPISSEAGANSNDMGNSSFGAARLAKETNGTPSEVNQTGVNKNTEHSDSALVASYIQEVNAHFGSQVSPMQNSLLDSPQHMSEEPQSPYFRKRH